MTEIHQTTSRRWPRRTLIGLILFAVVFHLGGGWYFSNVIKTDALEPRGPQHDFGVRVVAVGDTSITLDGTDRAAIEHPGTVGLWWQDGYGQVGPITKQEADVVTREFSIMYGEPPPTCPTMDLDQCPGVDLESHAYPNDPSDVGLDFEEVAYQTPLGMMGAWLVPPATGDNSIWAVHMHGWRAERREAVRMLPSYSQVGITSLVVDYRNDPESPADPSDLYKFGRTEWEDAEAAVQYALDHGAEKVVLVGYSTGAAAEMAFLENSQLADQIDGIVFDAPNIDFGRVISEQASERTIPGTPIPLPPTLIAAAKWIADQRFDVDWGAINYVSRDGILPVPTLVFHGTSDPRVPISVSEDLVEANPGLVTLITTENAGHVQSWNVDPERYAEILTTFLETVISDS